MRTRSLFVSVAALGLMAGASHAGTLITSDATYTGPALDLTGYDTGSCNCTFGPIAVGAFTFTAAPNFPLGGNTGTGSVVGQGLYNLGPNGDFGGDAVYIGVDAAKGYAQLLGATAYSQMGFFWNYFPQYFTADATISTLDAAGNVMQSFDLETLAPISTPNGHNQFAFRGVVDDTADIYGMRFGGNYILAAGTANGDIAGGGGGGGGNGGIPEPATWSLMILGFGAAGAMLRRRRLAA
jgi:hypothetical protein